MKILIFYASIHHQNTEKVAKVMAEELGANVTPQRGYPQKWPNEPPCWQADIAKAKEMLDWNLFMI